ncbi:MAG: replication-relaxation family protein [Chloroflexota bacterium]|nr:replication-relaxation family protein [Chloroflexota bacterium]
MNVDAERARRSLILLRRFGRLSTAQVAGLALDGSDLTPASRAVTARRVLQDLRARRLVAPVPRAVGGPTGGSQGTVHRLTEAGSRYLGGLGGGAGADRRDRRERASCEHALACADVALAFVRAARDNPGHAMGEWHPAFEAAELLGSTLVVPDGHFVYSTQTMEVDALVEVDLATERPAWFARKVGAYVALLRGGTWRAHLASWPLVLTITPSAERASSLRRASERALLGERDAQALLRTMRFQFAPLADIVREGALGRIWQRAGGEGLEELVPPPRDDVGACALDDAPTEATSDIGAGA